MTAFNFDEFSFNCDTLTLQKNGVDIPLRHQPAKLLKHLIEAAPGIVSRQSLQNEIWSDGVNVEFEQSLNACVNQLRTVLGDRARNARYIETLPKRGYRFIANIELASENTQPRIPRALFALAAIAMGAVLLFSLFSTKASDANPISVYVAPIASDFSTDENEDAIQYVLRLGIVERLTRYDRKNFMVISGESLWEDVDQDVGEKGYIHDYLLILNLRNEDQGYAVDAVLSSPNRVVEIARTRISIADLSPDLYAEAAEAVSSWAAEIIDAGASPVAPSDTALEYNTAYYRNMLNAQRTLRFGNYSSLVESIEWFEKALAISPQSVDALSGKAIALTMLVGQRDYPENETYDEIVRMADAIERNVGVHPQAQLVRGIVYLHRDWDVERAKAAVVRSSQMAPGDARILSWKATILALEGDFAAAVRASSAAVSMDPMSQVSNSDRCWHLTVAARYSEAVQYCDWALEINPRSTFNRLSLVLALQKSEQSERAVEVLLPLIDYVATSYGGPEFDPQTDEPSARLREMYRHMAEVLMPHAEEGMVAKYTIASFLAMCGDFEAIPPLLEVATKDREIGILYYELDAHFDEYRASLIARQANNSRFPSPDSRTP